MSYSWKSFSSAKTDLSQRLGDVSKTFWIDTELGVYLIEALRTFNSIAQFYRDRCFFNTQSGFAYYDLTQTSNPDTLTAGTGSTPQNPPSLLGYTVIDRDLINSIQYSILEPTTTNWAGGWTGTEQFTMDDVVRAIERRRNQFLSLVVSHITHSQVNYTSPPSNGRVALSDSIIDIHRVSWLNADASYSPLQLTDEQEANTLAPSYETSPSTPLTYSTLVQPPKGLQLIPFPNDVGIVDLLTINNPSNLNELTGVLLNIPDDYSWIIKWGALADLLGKDSQAYDPIRSQYCEQRFEDGIKIALAGTTINQIGVNGAYKLPSSLYDFDLYNPNWQNVSGQPTDVAVIARNLIALSPVPDDIYSIQLDVLRNIPIPSLGTDFLQIGREQYDLLLDYAFHLGMFKCAGMEFMGSYPHLDRFMQGAIVNNDKLMAQAKDYMILKELEKKELEHRPRLVVSGA